MSRESTREGASSDVVKKAALTEREMKEIARLWLNTKLSEARDIDPNALLVLPFDSDGTLFPHTWSENAEFLKYNAQFSNFAFFDALQKVIIEDKLSSNVEIVIVSNQWSSVEAAQSVGMSTKIGLNDVYKEQFPDLPLIGREKTHGNVRTGATKGFALAEYLGVKASRAVICYVDDDRNKSYEDKFPGRVVSSMYGTRTQRKGKTLTEEERAGSCMTTWQAVAEDRTDSEKALKAAQSGGSYGFCPESVVLNLIQTGHSHEIPQATIASFGCKDLGDLSKRVSAGMGVSEPLEIKQARDAVDATMTAIEGFNKTREVLNGLGLKINSLGSQKKVADENLERVNKGVGGFFRRLVEGVGIKTDISKFKNQAQILDSEIKDQTVSMTEIERQMKKQKIDVEKGVKEMIDVAQILSPNDILGFVKGKIGEDLLVSLSEEVQALFPQEQSLVSDNSHYQNLPAIKAAQEAAAARAAEAEAAARAAEQDIFGIVPTIAEREAAARAAEAAQIQAAQSFVTAGRQDTVSAGMPEGIYENVPSKAAQEASERALQSLIEGTKSKPVVLQPLYMNLPGAVQNQDESVVDEGYQSTESLAEKSLNEQLMGMERFKLSGGQSKSDYYCTTVKQIDGSFKQMFTFDLEGNKKLDVVFLCKEGIEPEFLGVRQRESGQSRLSPTLTSEIITADLPGCARLLEGALDFAKTPGTAPKDPVASAAARVVGSQSASLS